MITTLLIGLRPFNPNLKAPVRTPYWGSIREYADEHSIGKLKLYKFLRDQGVLDPGNEPMSGYESWFSIRQYDTDSYYAGTVNISDLTEEGYDEVTNLINKHGGKAYINSLKTR